MKKLLSISFVIIIFFSGMIGSALQTSYIENEIEYRSISIEDYDPLIDINITIDILAIRALDEIECSQLPNFYLKMFIGEDEFVSPVWFNESYLYNCWSVSKDVDDNIELVNITIELWNKGLSTDQICDISKEKNVDDIGYAANLFYSLKTGKWHGDDYYIGDSSGYARLCGCDDGSIYQDENDCEVFFNIYQNDYDGDGLPYYVENFVYGTDPEVNNLGEDNDFDGVPIEWEHKWGFNPLVWDDHEHIDLDGDSLNNSEEFLTNDFGSDPFRKDIFLEMDFMENESGGEQIKVPDETFELFKNPFSRQNIVIHFDIGEVEGGEVIPFDDYTDENEFLEMYRNFFLHNDSENWRRGVFHYGLVVFHRKPSMAFSGDVPPYYGYFPSTNSFVISRSAPVYFYKEYNGEKSMAFLYAISFMHELGHTFGIKFGKPFGCDNFFGTKPWMPAYWRFGRYKSIMNYRYFFSILDYSDGSHGLWDYDDWGHIDFTYFEKKSANTLKFRNLSN